MYVAGYVAIAIAINILMITSQNLQVNLHYSHVACSNFSSVIFKSESIVRVLLNKHFHIVYNVKYPIKIPYSKKRWR